jgi:hypothetical protein
LHELSDRRDREDSAYAIYAEDKKGNVYRVTPVPFFFPQKPVERSVLVTLEVTGKNEKGALPAKFVDIRQACGPLPKAPKVGDTLLCRVERSGKDGTLLIVKNGWWGRITGEHRRNAAPELRAELATRRKFVRLQVADVDKPSRLVTLVLPPIESRVSLEVLPVEAQEATLDHKASSGEVVVDDLTIHVDRAVIARDAAFRSKVLRTYLGMCVICGEGAKVAGEWFVEAAHVVPKAIGGPDELSNAICLCPNHHWAFDRGLVGFDSDGVVRVAEIARRSTGKIVGLFKGIEGRTANCPRNVALPHAALRWHFHNVFRRYVSRVDEHDR